MNKIQKQDEYDETNNFQKNVKDKQGNLFSQGPDYLKGKGFQGEVDNEINYQIVNTSSMFNYSQTQQFGKEYTKTINIDDINLLQSTSKQFSNQECHSAELSLIQKTQDVSFNLQPAPQGDLNLKRQENDQFQGDIIKLRASQSNQDMKMMYREQSNLSNDTPNNSQLQSFNQNNRKKWLISKYGDQYNQLNSSINISQRQIKKDQSNNQLSSLSKFEGAKNKLVDKLISVELAKKIICNVFHKSSNHKERVKMITKEFIHRLRDLSSNKRADNLKEVDYQFINDLSYFSEKKVTKNLYKQFDLMITKYKLFINSLKVIQPTNTFLIIWDLFQIAFTYFFCYLYSILLFFNFAQKEGYFLTNFINIAFLLFLLDIILTFNIAYYSKDQIIISRRLIAKKYISSFFITDLASIIVLSLKTVFTNISLQYNPTHDLLIYLRNVLILLKIFGTSKKRKRIEDTLIFNDNQKLIMKIISLVFFTITIAHFVGITWHTLAVIEHNYDIELTWMKKLNIIDTPFYTRYIYSVYWSMTTMTTIGYGDITPQNQYESLFTTLNMIFLSCIFAYSINNIGIILQEIEKKSRILRDEISTFQRFLDRKKVNTELKSRVRHYLKFLANEQKDRNKDKEDQIFQKLSNELRDQVTKEINQSIIERYHIFSKLFTKKTREQIAFVMKEVLVSPNEIIFLDNQIDDQAIYFIQGGCIEIFHTGVQKEKNSHLSLKYLQQNDLFGELSFFSGLSRKASARSINLSTLYKIKREDFINIIKQNPEDFEKFKMVQDKILNQNDLSQIEMKCYICQKENHLSSNCPKIHQKFDKQFHILKNNFSINQERRHQTRKLKIILSPWDLINRNKIYLRQLRENIERFDTQMQIMIQEEDDEFNKDKNCTYQTMTSFKSQEDEDEIKEGSQLLISQSFKVDNPMLSDKEKEKAISEHSSFYPEKQSFTKNFFQRKNKTNQSIKIQQIQEENEEGCSKILISAFVDQNIANPLETDSNKQSNQTINQENLPNSMSFSNRDINNFFTTPFGRKQTFMSKKETKSSNQNEAVVFNKQEVLSNEQQFQNTQNQVVSVNDQNVTQQTNKDENTNTYNQTNQIAHQQQHQQFKYIQQASSRLFNYDSQNTLKQTQMHNNQNNNLIQSLQTDLLAFKNEQEKLNLQQNVQNPQNNQINQNTSKQKGSGFKEDLIPQEFATLFDLIKKINQKEQQENMNESGNQIQEDINSLDKIKIYKIYFPHNNFDKIMHEYNVKKKEQQVMNQVQKKIKGKILYSQKHNNPIRSAQNLLGEQNTNQFIEGSSLNLNLLQPTTLQYGIGIKGYGLMKPISQLQFTK